MYVKIRHFSSSENKCYLKNQNERKFKHFHRIFIDIHEIYTRPLRHLLRDIFCLNSADLNKGPENTKMFWLVLELGAPQPRGAPLRACYAYL